MLSEIQEEGFYRTSNGSLAYVIFAESNEGTSRLILLAGGSEEFMPGDTYDLHLDGSMFGAEDVPDHPLLLRGALDMELPPCRRWNPLRKGQKSDYATSCREWGALMQDMQHLLEKGAGHCPPTPEVGSFYYTLNWSIVYVLEIEEGDVHVAILKGGAAGLAPGYTYVLRGDGSPGGFNPLEFGLVLYSRVEVEGE